MKPLGYVIDFLGWTVRVPSALLAGAFLAELIITIIIGRVFYPTFIVLCVVGFVLAGICAGQAYTIRLAVMVAADRARQLEQLKAEQPGAGQ